MNYVCISGRLTADPTVREVSSTKVATFNIASNRRYKKVSGEVAEETTFVPVELWDSGASTAEKILKKGDMVIVEGSWREDNWEKDGVKHSRVKCRANNFEKMWAPKAADTQTQSVEEPTTAGVGTGEDIPF